MDTGLCWTVANVRSDPLASGVKTLADTFNTAYMQCMPASVKLVDFRATDFVAVPHAETVFPPGSFAQQVGLAAGEATEMSSYAQARGYGSLNGGSSAWKLHGIAQSFVDGSTLIQSAPVILGLLTACRNYLFQYREVATAGPPAGRGYLVVSPPVIWPQILLTGMYKKALGRPFLFPGQQRFVRQAP
jgi:hypothetical protein